jgi:hypothetical protein
MANSTGYIGWGIGVSQGLATARSGAARRRKSWRAADGHLGRSKGGDNLRKGIRGPGWCSPCSGWEGVAAQDANVEVRRWSLRRRDVTRRRGQSRGPPGIWVARIDAWSYCEVGRRVSGNQRSTAARKFDGGASSPVLRSGAIPPRSGPRPSVEDPRWVLVFRRGSWVGWQGPVGCGGAVPRRRRGVCSE